MKIRRNLIAGLLLKAIECTFNWQYCNLMGELNALQNSICRLYRSKLAARQPWMMGQNTPKPPLLSATVLRPAYTYSMDSSAATQHERNIMMERAQQEVSAKTLQGSLCGNRSLLLCLPSAASPVESSPLEPLPLGGLSPEMHPHGIPLHDAPRDVAMHDVMLAHDMHAAEAFSHGAILPHEPMPSPKVMPPHDISTDTPAPSGLPNLVITIGSTDKHGNTVNDMISRIVIRKDGTSPEVHTSIGPNVSINDMCLKQPMLCRNEASPSSAGFIGTRASSLAPTNVGVITGSFNASSGFENRSIVASVPPSVPSHTAMEKNPAPTKTVPIKPIKPSGISTAKKTKKPYKEYDEDSSSSSDSRHSKKKSDLYKLKEELKRQKAMLKRELKTQFMESEKKLQKEIKDLKRKKIEEEGFLERLRNFRWEKSKKRPEIKYTDPSEYSSPALSTKSPGASASDTIQVPWSQPNNEPTYISHSNTGNKEALMRIERALRDLERRTDPEILQVEPPRTRHTHTHHHYVEAEPAPRPTVVYKHSISPIEYTTTSDSPEYVINRPSLSKRKNNQVVYIRASSIL
ncbi:uncharacterized protein NEMAJ01_1788 [Nematocida major]|uniref:uncharacterized protein n=1 Tax=Nematocida major TaxID=1912982 RepID=UPI002008EAA7|nr:uncharacterized protein NEMAJ01_1788 [Nematocida major]KAH9386892.1 hypothetical protein NEMAJ01_1788 [Nematocida major]